MDRGRSAERARQEIVRLSHAGLDSRTFGIEAVKQLRKASPTDVSFFATADPATLLFTSAVGDNVLTQATSQFLEREFLKDDPVKFAQLAKRRSPVDSLGMVTKGELARSARYREMLAPMDPGDELSVIDCGKGFDKVLVSSKDVTSRCERISRAPPGSSTRPRRTTSPAPVA